MPIHDRLYLLLKRRRRELPCLKQLPHLSEMEPYTALRTMLEVLPLNVVESIADALEAQDPLPEEAWAPFFGACRGKSWNACKAPGLQSVRIPALTR